MAENFKSRIKKKWGHVVLVLLILLILSNTIYGEPITYKIENAVGYIEKIDNILNVTIVSNFDNVYKAEYYAGFVQGKLEKKYIISARDNSWDTAYLVDPSHSLVTHKPPSTADMMYLEDAAIKNYNYTLNYIQRRCDPILRENLERLLYRLIGIYHGTKLDSPAKLSFDGKWIPPTNFFSPQEMKLGYETPYLTFMDVYFVNAFLDLLYLPGRKHPSMCSAFLKRNGNEILMAHNSWYSFLSQSMVTTFYINGDYMCVNALMPGLLASSTDFGYNNKGIMFTETTHDNTFTKPKINSLWMFWRGALAEQFSHSLDEFFDYVSLDTSGTYLNGYMVADTKNNQMGLIEMSYKNFIYFRSNSKGGYDIITKPKGISKEYDKELLKPDYILGINFPLSQIIRDDLLAIENRPARRRQFLKFISGIDGIESAKKLITYTDPNNPLSIYGRWDLGYGETPTPKVIPEGSIDAKAISSSMVEYAAKLEGKFDKNSPNKGFWMKFGTPIINGSPFIWSKSIWKYQKLRDVPDELTGGFHLINTYVK